MSKQHRILQLRIALRDSCPPIWRRIQIDANHSFLDLHNVLQLTMGWESEHTFQFVVNGLSLTESSLFEDVLGDDAREFQVGELLTQTGQHVLYRYDMGDNWLHDVQLEAILTAEGMPPVPFCTGGENACPPENCAGIDGYNNLLDVLADADHIEHRELREWVGYEFEPTYFSRKTVNKALLDWTLNAALDVRKA